MPRALHVRDWVAMMREIGAIPNRDSLIGVSVTLAARLLGISRSRIHQLLNARKLAAVDVYDERRIRIGHMVTLAEEVILTPVVEKLLSPRFIEHAVKAIRELARREREAPPVEVTVALERADAQIVELERMVREGVLSPAVAALALAKARSERQAALRAPAGRLPRRAPDSLAPAAEAAFRETVVHMAKVLQGENLIEARELLR